MKVERAAKPFFAFGKGASFWRKAVDFGDFFGRFLGKGEGISERVNR